MVFIPDESDFDVEYRSVPMPLDPKMLRMARRIYRSYRMLHPRSQKQPLGIAIHKETHRGQLMFNRQPVLLPGECFVPLNQLEAEAQVV
ncbi:ssr2554 [Synechocystis sp. PCC 6803]|jgi:hypothetical protein|uniref:Ssr2554 protein n=2 Tax=Synechocystis TaxID=1142 RepID=P73961_SYNY3|nr:MULTISPECIES: hypothetical protein [unclassified Synechocystis]MBD2639935.1 hypothetical protein [Synechocystis sp. FACHB-908]MBD2662134.1 hypothetical protein [Synechocystis sp. FACHB-929]BAL29200.1 hypothetical protein SYNGTI_1453 [Synechocystis sp. PCC 6803 substr. GT-I]BAL32369.1 hypothetical protein SYNPCCN_1452 [Synechocystis sp. PCC 6803 substr. PCC-N]BAL35538.1 hypothetical protein SYNPCCP_1452 [Synechocystis sp. PCC 6803 substr. PCC-P]BAM51788.1 hypothetical protein BEST7613_2857 